MYQNQQTKIQELKSAASLINGYNLQNGHVLDGKLYKTISTSLFTAVQCHFCLNTTFTDTHTMVPSPPELSQTPHIPTIINTNPSQSGAAFARRGSRTPYQPKDNSVGYILAISINGHSYNGSIFDANGTQLY